MSGGHRHGAQSAIAQPAPTWQLSSQFRFSFIKIKLIFMTCASPTCNVLCTHDYTGITLTNITIVKQASVLKQRLLKYSQLICQN